MKIKQLKEHQKIFYQEIGCIFCPVLEDMVHFTSYGFNHLVSKPNRNPRKIGEQKLKLYCLTFAPQVVANSTEIVTTRETKLRIKGKWKSVIRLGIIYEVKPGVVMRVIIEKIGDGNYQFLSVMPHTRKSKNRNKKHPKV